MPQHIKGNSPPACLIPADINLEQMEEDCIPEAGYKTQIPPHFIFNSGSPNCDSEDTPNSQGSISSQVFEMFNVGSQTSNDNDETCEEYPDLCDLVIKVTKQADDSVIEIHRSMTPTVNVEDSPKGEITVDITPMKKSKEVEVDPLTPTANLKMLISAASPEIRNRERLKEMQRAEEEQEASSEHSNELVIADVPTKNAPEPVTVSRKEKSLGLLCQRFLARYPENPDPLEREEICLDEVAKELMVERRRIYDIVNVLESVEMVSRVAKNRYTWHGKSTLNATLVSLKMLAEKEGFAEKIDHIRMCEEFRDLGDSSVTASPRKKSPQTLNDVSNVQRSTLYGDFFKKTGYYRKDKSLGIMSQRFLMLFLVSRNKPINLDLAAKILIGDPTIDLTENAKFKTKIRRLYDIANILTSLDLIRKVHLAETKGRKPAFKYIGPEVTLNKSQTGDESEKRPASRHSLLDIVKKSQECPTPQPNASTAESPIRQQGVSKSMVSERLPLRKPFGRHSSLDHICEIAERERNRLYFESKSQPSSPVKAKPCSKRSLLPKTKSMPPMVNDHSSIEVVSKPASKLPLKQFVMIRSTHGSQKVAENSSESKNLGVHIEKLPINRPGSGPDGMAPGQSREHVLLRTRLVEQTRGSGGECQPRLVKVSRDQLDSVLKSLNKDNTSAATPLVKQCDATGPRPVPKIHVVHMQSRAQQGLSTPGTGGVVEGIARKRPAEQSLPNTGSDCYFDSKRPRTGEMAPQQPVSPHDDRNVSQLIHDKCRPSPRVLHLDPEFRSPGGHCQKTPSPELPVVEQLASPLDCSIIQPQTPSCTTPSQFTPGPIQSAFSMVNSSTAQQVFTFSNCTSPALVLTTPESSASYSVGDASKYATPARNSSPQALPGVSGMASLHRSCSAFPSHIVSPVPLHISPATVTRPAFMLKHFGGIRPSSNAIINLIPHLTDGATATASEAPTRMHKISRRLSPQTTVTSSQPLRTHSQPFRAGEGFHSPAESCCSANMTPTNMVLTNDNTTPVSTRQLPVTPSTYFRSTPGGVFQFATIPSVVLGQPLSAFQPLSSLAGHSVTTTSSTARRLALVEGDNP